MNLLKKVLFPFFSLFLAYRSIELMKVFIGMNPNNMGTTESLLLGYLFTLFVTGVFAFIGFAYPTSKILPNVYYRIKNPKKLNAVCKAIGVKYFKLFLLKTFWGKEKNRKKYFNGTKQGIQNFIYQTKQSEFGHLAPFVVILICSIVLLTYGHFLLVSIMSFFNVIGNLYPILLQRSHRIRIQNVIKI